MVLGAAWAWRASWALSVPLGALAKVGGTLGGIGLACFTLHENLFAVLLNNVYSLVVRPEGRIPHSSPHLLVCPPSICKMQLTDYHIVQSSADSGCWRLHVIDLKGR